MKEIWVEKYRPRTLDEIVGQDEIVERLKAYRDSKNLPHLLFAGPAGTGKTTSAMALSRDLFGDDWRQNYSELNASVGPETPCLVRIGEETERTTFGALGERVFGAAAGGRKELENVQILSLDSRHRVRFLPASWISRHRVPEILTIRYEGGQVRTSADHSVMVFDACGQLVPKPAGELRVDDQLVSFADTLPGHAPELDLERFHPRPLRPRGVERPNPRLAQTYGNRPLNGDLAWLLGLYVAEGCSILPPRDTSGGLVWTVGFPQEATVADRASRVLWEQFSLVARHSLGRSGFDRTKRSSLQVRALNTQLARFFRNHCYDSVDSKSAPFKRIPKFLFDASPDLRIAYLKGYMGDASGTWGGCVRYSSVSQQGLIDVAWLGRMAGLNTSVYPREARIIWNMPSFSYVKTDLIPSTMVHELFRRLGIRDTYFLRHSMYGKKSARVSKSSVLDYLDSKSLAYVPDPTARRLVSILQSPLSTVRITEILRRPYDGYVYDVSVPGSEMFWGGTTPILLHNSDERGIDTVRTKIKEIARLAPFGGTDFKLIFLDEADNLTADAQAALRRTMETYSRTSRFILSANYSSRIIEPIQSRCAVFRFRPLKPEAIKSYLGRIAKAEKLKITEDGLEALVYVSEGDMRRAVNSLQVAASLNSTIDADALYKVASTIRPEEVKKIIERALAGEFLKAREVLDKLLIEYGVSGEDVVRQLHRVIFDLNVPDEVKVRLLDRVGETDYRLVEGSNERIQIEALLAHFALVGQEIGKK